MSSARLRDQFSPSPRFLFLLRPFTRCCDEGDAMLRSILLLRLIFFRANHCLLITDIILGDF
jgi:hypothetical protein